MMQKLLRKIDLEKGNIFSILSTSFLGSATSFVMVLAFANLVDAHTLGTYQYIISVVSIIGAFTLTGLLTSLIRAVSRKEYFFLAYAKKFLYIGSLPGFVIGAVISLYYVVQGNYVLALGIFVSNIFYLLLQILYRFNALYVALEDIKTANLLLKLYAVAPLVGVLPALFFIKDAHILVILYFASTYFSFLIGIRLFKMDQKEKELIPVKHSDTNSAYKNREHLKFAFHQSVIAGLNAMTAHMDKIIIFQLLGAQQTAIYFIALSIPNRFRSIIKQFDSFFFSRFAKHNLTAVQNKITSRFFTALVLIVPFYVIYLLAAPLIFRMFLPQYLNAVFFSQIYAITLFTGAIIIPQSVLKAHANSSELYFNSIALAIVKAALILGGVYFYGLLGAIWGAAISLLVYTIISLFSSLKIRD
jgi:O-antigen/teichoic acid export membrane protein